MLRAMAAAGNYQGAIDVIRQYWGSDDRPGCYYVLGRFQYGLASECSTYRRTCCLKGKKDIHGDYGDYCYKGFRHSLCHGWASGPDIMAE